jgi:hypothetical protein
MSSVWFRFPPCEAAAAVVYLLRDLAAVAAARPHPALQGEATFRLFSLFFSSSDVSRWLENFCPQDQALHKTKL